MKKNLKAQIRMTETIAILFIFFVLIIFGIMFYYRYSQVALKEKQEEQLGAKTADITLKALYLPELVCSRGESQPILDCFDLVKLRQVSKVFSEHYADYYFNLFPYSKITVKELYPDSTLSWTLYDKPKPKENNQEGGKEVIDFVVVLRDDLKGQGNGEYSFGILTVEVYS